MITLTREEAQQVLDALSHSHAREPIWKTPLNTAIETLRARLRAPEPDYRDVVIKGDLWRIEFLPDHAASVVLVRANYEAQPEPEPVAWKNAAIRLGEELSSVGPDGYYDMTPQEWLDWALDQQPSGKSSLPTPPQREWQSLTDEDRWELVQQTPSFDETVAAVEAKLREKNTCAG